MCHFTENFPIKFGDGDIKKIISLKLFLNKSYLEYRIKKTFKQKQIPAKKRKKYFFFAHNFCFFPFLQNNGTGGSVKYNI